MSKNIKNLNFFVFWATTTIHTFLKSSDKTVIKRQGQKSDIATGQGSGAKFSLYRRTHCIYTLGSQTLEFWFVSLSVWIWANSIKTFTSSLCFAFAFNLFSYNIKMIRFFVVTGFCPHYATDPRDFGTKGKLSTCRLLILALWLNGIFTGFYLALCLLSLHFRTSFSW